MHEPVHSIFHSKLLSALRLPSFAGEGLPERMRSISFALLGLTAAAGLALVAIFAQPGFTLLSPAPLPDRPSAGQSIAKAKKLTLVHRPVALLAAQPVRSQEIADPPSPGASPTTAGGEDAPTPGAVDVPASTGAPEPSSGNSGGGNGDGSGGGPGSAPAAAPEPVAASPSAPVSSPAPKSAAPAPEATASTPDPEPAPAPGNSASAAAAEHASERGIEASAGSSSTAANSGATTASVAPAAASPGNGNGLAKGLNK
jgi:hypothetical protein